VAVGDEMRVVSEIERLRSIIKLLHGEIDGLRSELTRRDDVAASEERQQAERLRRSYTATVRALSNAVEARDAYTGKHAERVAAYGLELARELGLPALERPEIEFGFLLHDIGKVGIPDAILYKPGPLTNEERALMSQHPVIGAEIIRGIEFLGDAALVVRSHHERWDGSGYPDGLAGEEIPVTARVFAVADVLDAVTTGRPYRPASSFAGARQMILAEAGKHFDPAVLIAFDAIPDDTFRGIAARIG
jgi:putative nucleotidyltransferase with HDIG domain